MVGESVATYGSTGTAVQATPSPGLGEHEEELNRLVSFIDLADGFALAFAECNFDHLRDTIIDEARRRCAALGIEIETIDLGEIGNLGPPIDEILARIPGTAERDRDGKQALMVCGLRAHVDITDDHPDAFAALNLARDAFPRRLPYPLVFWLPDYLLTTLSRTAPDLWAWRSDTSRFPASSTLYDQSTEGLLHARAQRHILGAEVADIEQRMRELEGILQEDLPSVGDVQPDRLPAILDVLNELGLGRYGLGQPQEAKKHWERALDLARSHGERQAEAAALSNLGLAHDALGDVRKEIECYEQALPIMREIGDRRSEGIALGNLGAAYLSIGDEHKAIDCCQQALALHREMGDRRGEGNVLGNLGNAYMGLGDAHTAIRHYEQALSLTRETGARRSEGKCLGNLGLAYAILGDMGRAIRFYEKDLAIAREIGDRQGECTVLAGLGQAWRQLGDAGRAKECIEQGLRLALRGRDQVQVAQIARPMGAAFDDLRDPRRATAMAAFALFGLQGMGDPQAQTAARDLAEYRAQLGDVAFREALDNAQHTVAAIFQELAGRVGEDMAEGFSIDPDDFPWSD